MQQKYEYSTIFDCIEFRVLQNMCSNSAFADIKHDICAGCRGKQESPEKKNSDKCVQQERVFLHGDFRGQG